LTGGGTIRVDESAAIPTRALATSTGETVGKARPPRRVIEYRTPIVRTPAAPRVPTSRWIEGFFWLQMACQLALMMPGIGGMRMVVRVAAFGASLALLLVLRPRYRQHPAAWIAVGIVALLALAVFHPLTNTFTAGFAQAFLYAAILAPLWWVSGCKVDEAGLRRIVLLLWGFNATSAMVGVVQVQFPGMLTPEVSTVVSGQGDWYVEDMKITLANGARVFRPMGLSDYPGGAAGSGFFCVLLGLGLWAGERNGWLRIAYLAALPVALFVLYMSQVRSLMVMTGLCAMAFMGLMALRGEVAKVAGLGITLVGVILASFGWAVWVGGEVVTKRLSSLIDDKPGEVYYSNRGHFLEDTVNKLLPKYPLGAGLGRWGMMYYYFGDKQDRERGEIWAEIQWTGWVLDGGIPLVLLYVSAIGAAFVVAGRIALSRRGGTLPLLGAMVLAYDVAALATTFNYPLFIGQGGLEFWILNASLFAAWTGTKRREVYVITGTAEELRGLAGGRNVALPARVRRAMPGKTEFAVLPEGAVAGTQGMVGSAHPTGGAV